MQHDTNANTRLIIKKQFTIAHPERDDILLEIENYTGFMNFTLGMKITIQGQNYKYSFSSLEFIDNKPEFTIYVHKYAEH